MAAALLASPYTQAAQDWLPRPAFPGDEITATRLSGPFRADGLLEVWDRYLPGESENRPLEDLAKAAYSIDKRLIDCETGYHLTVDETLYDADGKVVAVRQNGKELFLIELVRRYEETGARWPQHDGIFEACAAASQPKKAPRPQPLLAKRSALADKSDEHMALVAALLAGPQIDLKKLAARKPASPAALLDLMREQYRLWRTSFNLPHAVLPAREYTDAEIEGMNNELGVDGVYVTFKLVDGLIVDITHRADADSVPASKGARVDYYQAVDRVDCATGLSVPMQRTAYGSKSQVLYTTVLNGAQALAETRKRLAKPGDEANTRLRGAHLSPHASEVCQALRAPVAPPEEHANALLLHMTADQLMANPDPAAILLNVRAAVRRQFKL